MPFWFSEGGHHIQSIQAVSQKCLKNITCLQDTMKSYQTRLMSILKEGKMIMGDLETDYSKKITELHRLRDEEV